MRRLTARVSTLALVLLAAASTEASAQRVLGPGDDALVLPRGVFRVRALYQRTEFDQRYGEDTPGRPDGALEPLAIDFNLDTIGIEQFRNLTRVQAGLRSLSGIPDFRLSLGQTIVNSNVTVMATPIVFEGGITDKISVGLTIPYVRTKNEIDFDVNPLGREGNTGFNPALSVAAAAQQNALLVQQLTNAANQLEAAAGCAGNPNQNACALVAQTRGFAAGIAGLYGTAVGTGSPFVPITGTEAQLAIEGRLAGLKAQYPAAIGGQITVTGPFAAQSRLTVADAQTILTNPAFGVAAEPLETVERSSIGDIELGAKYLWLDSFRGSPNARYTASGFNYRSAVTLLARFGTGDPDLPENFVDVGTGGGQHDLELRLANDVVWGSSLWSSFIFRYGIQFADEEELRISDRPNQRLTAVWRQQQVDRDLGDYFEFEANPRFALTDWFQVGGHYLFRSKQQDEFTGTFQIDTLVTGYSVDGAPTVTLDASTLELETKQKEHRMGAGFTISTLALFEKKKFAIPFEVTYLHYQTTSGEGNVVKQFTDQLQLRLYTKLFGK